MFGGYDLTGLTQSTNSPTIYSKLVATINGIGAPVYPHHPVNCLEPETWTWGEEGMSCKHSSVSMVDEKLQAAINFSITELLIEIARETL